MPTYNPNQPMAMFNGLVTDLNVQVGTDTISFAALPANGVVADMPGKGMFLAIDSAAVYREVDTAIKAIEQDLATVPTKTKLLDGYKSLRMENNPEAQREKELSDLKGEISEMRQMLSAVLNKAKEN